VSADSTPAGAPLDRIAVHPARRRIAVLNAKGGCGKTTIATNLAALYAVLDVDVALVDHDAQGSATHWLDARAGTRPRVQGVAAYKRTGTAVTRTFQLGKAFQAHRVVVDTPAAAPASDLGAFLREADRVIIPVLPSTLDIKAAARFIGQLLLDREYRARRIPVAVVANRVRRNTIAYGRLQRFLASLDIPFACTLRDTQRYVRAAEVGEGLFDSPTYAEHQDREAWRALLAWLERPRLRPTGR